MLTVSENGFRHSVLSLFQQKLKLIYCLIKLKEINLYTRVIKFYYLYAWKISVLPRLTLLSIFHEFIFPRHALMVFLSTLSFYFRF